MKSKPKVVLNILPKTTSNTTSNTIHKVPVSNSVNSPLDTVPVINPLILDPVINPVLDPVPNTVPIVNNPVRNPVLNPAVNTVPDVNPIVNNPSDIGLSDIYKVVSKILSKPAINDTNITNNNTDTTNEIPEIISMLVGEENTLLKICLGTASSEEVEKWTESQGIYNPEEKAATIDMITSSFVKGVKMAENVMGPNEPKVHNSIKKDEDNILTKLRDIIIDIDNIKIRISKIIDELI